ncbi:MAG: cupin domain-containing protein [Candidatus Izimaplasma sp.]|nr:cupin domain-containing protein [Candidatus Izimaplasma bacterium]
MIIDNIDNIKSKKVTSPDAKNAFMKVLVSNQEGWDDYVMRVVEVEENGYTPRHKHPWPHINYVIQGKGSIMIAGKDTEVEKGSFAFVPTDNLHQYKNNGKETFKFICIVPKAGHK